MKVVQVAGVLSSLLSRQNDEVKRMCTYINFHWRVCFNWSVQQQIEVLCQFWRTCVFCVKTFCSPSDPSRYCSSKLSIPVTNLFAFRRKREGRSLARDYMSTT